MCPQRELIKCSHTVSCNQETMNKNVRQMNRTAIDWREGIFWDVDVSFYFLWGNIESSEGEKNETKQLVHRETSPVLIVLRIEPPHNINRSRIGLNQTAMRWSI